MSVTTISNSLGLRAGDGRVATSFSTNKSSAASSSTNITSLSSSSVPAMPANTAVTNSSKNINIDGKNNNVSPKDNQSKTHLGSVPTITVSSSDPPLPKAYGKIVLTLENVLIPEDKISPTPSSLDGLDPECEIDFRIMGCELIVSSGTLLKLPQTAMATGQVLFQRFYYSKSFVRQPMETTAIACVYLASKIEEAPRRIRDVINVFHHIKQVRSGKLIQPLILDQSYVRLKSDVTLAERRVLKELGFCVHVKHPHKLIVIYMQQLGYDKDSRFVQMSWNYMNDALRSNVFVRYTPEAIACACIFLSGRMLKILLPTNPAWYMVFDVSESQIIDICENILMLYERPKVQYEQLEKKVDILVKSYQDSRQKSKSSTSSLMDKPSSGTPNTSSPGSRPNSPSAGPQSAATASLTKPKESSDNEKRRRHEDNDQDGRRSAASSPAPKKSRRSPSPIVYITPRHKHKKRKKSRHSHSESSSPSRSRERRSVKKHARRERSRSPYSPRRHHHKKSKSHHRDRYKSRSRSFSPSDRDRERGRSPQETLGKYDQKDYDKYYYKMKAAKSSSKHNRDREEDLGRGKGGRDKDRR